MDTNERFGSLIGEPDGYGGTYDPQPPKVSGKAKFGVLLAGFLTGVLLYSATTAILTPAIMLASWALGGSLGFVQSFVLTGAGVVIATVLRNWLR